MIEELAGALLWFNPAVWLLLGQARLAREQCVDQETVRITAAPEQYVDALLAMARGRNALDLAPAPLFLRRRHLTQRMHLLLEEVSVSRLRLWTSYGSISTILAMAGCLACAYFPLVGTPQLQAASVQTASPQVERPGDAQPNAKRVPRAIGPGASTPTAPPVPARIPTDPHELVVGSAQPPASPAERAAVLALLERARQNSNWHLPGTPSFLLTANYTASGNVSETGSGQIVETWLSGRMWHYTQSLGRYSETRIGSGGSMYGVAPAASVPMRVQMVRSSIFAPIALPGSSSNLRVAAAEWQGRPNTCILLARTLVMEGDSDRQWKEVEYCIDNASGLLQIYSPAPGTYVVYGYARNEKFRGRFVPDRVTAYAAGAPAFEAQVDVTDPGPSDGGLFSPSPEMTVVPHLIVGMRMAISAPAPSVSDAGKAVIVHAAIDPSGQVLDQELSTAPNPTLATAAMEHVRLRNFGPANAQREAFILVRFELVTQ